MERRRVVAAFDGGTVSSDAGSLLLKHADGAVGLLDRLAGCFADRRDPVFGVLLGKLTTGRKGCAPLAGKSTLHRFELYPRDGLSRYHRIVPEVAALEWLFVELFLDAHRQAPEEIILDLDATDDPLHGHQEGRFFHGFYDGYCCLPLYIFGREHLLVAKLRRADIDGSAAALEEVERVIGQIRGRWPDTRILLRADSGFARDGLMSWCAQNAVDYLFGLARNARLRRAIGAELHQAALESRATGRPARRFKERVYATRSSWSRSRRVVCKAEPLGDKWNPRFVVTSLPQTQIDARMLYEALYSARGQMANRIKEAQLDLFADRLSTETFGANQLRLWLSSCAYVLMHALRRIGLAGAQFARATAHTIRLKLLKIGAVITASVRRIRLALSSAHPYQAEYRAAFEALGAAAR